VKKAVFIIAMVMFLKPILPVFEYMINYEYISKVLCVNKDKPKMKCNGKCHLMQELAKSSENEKPISDKKISINEFEVLFFQDLNSYVISCTPIFKAKKIDINYSNLYTHLNNCSVFHPPTFIS
jgi:hypothetical protein